MLGIDICWAKWSYYVSKKHAFLASVWGTGIMLMSGINTIIYVNNWILLIPAVIGGFVGTYWAVKTSKN